MTLKTRGSASLDKAQRRLASLKSIDENLDLGHGLTVSAYTQLIEATRAALEAHNTLVSDIDASRRNLTSLEKALSELSSRMLTGVSTRYGRNSIQYSMAGGSVPKHRQAAAISASEAVSPMYTMVTPDTPMVTNGQAS